MDSNRSDSLDPYKAWLGIPNGERPPNHYDLLGLHLFESEVAVIRHAADERTKIVRPRCLKHRELATHLLNQISMARVCLCNPSTKAEYDETIRSGDTKAIQMSSLRQHIAQGPDAYIELIAKAATTQVATGAQPESAEGIDSDTIPRGVVSKRLGEAIEGEDPVVWALHIGERDLRALCLWHHRDVEDVEVLAVDTVEYTQYPSEHTSNANKPHDAALREFLASHDLRGCKVAVTTDARSPVFRIGLPDTLSGNLDDVVASAVHRTVPYPLDRTAWGYYIVNDDDTEDYAALDKQAIVCMMRREEMEGLLQPFEEADVDVSVVVASPLALYNFAVYEMFFNQPFDSDDPPPPQMLVSINANSTNVLITDGHHLVDTTLVFSGNRLARLLGKQLHVSLAEAERLKARAVKQGDSDDVFERLRPELADFSDRVRDIISDFHRRVPHEVAQVILLGSEAQLCGLQQYLAERLECEVSGVATFIQLTGDSILGSPAFLANSPRLATCYGLGLQALGMSKCRLNLAASWEKAKAKAAPLEFNLSEWAGQLRDQARQSLESYQPRVVKRVIWGALAVCLACLMLLLVVVIGGTSRSGDGSREPPPPGEDDTAQGEEYDVKSVLDDQFKGERAKTDKKRQKERQKEFEENLAEAQRLAQTWEGYERALELLESADKGATPDEKDKVESVRQKIKSARRKKQKDYDEDFAADVKALREEWDHVDPAKLKEVGLIEKAQTLLQKSPRVSTARKKELNPFIAALETTLEMNKPRAVPDDTPLEADFPKENVPAIPEEPPPDGPIKFLLAHVENGKHRIYFHGLKLVDPSVRCRCEEDAVVSVVAGQRHVELCSFKFSEAKLRALLPALPDEKYRELQQRMLHLCVIDLEAPNGSRRFIALRKPIQVEGSIVQSESQWKTEVELPALTEPALLYLGDGRLSWGRDFEFGRFEKPLKEWECRPSPLSIVRISLDRSESEGLKIVTILRMDESKVAERKRKLNDEKKNIEKAQRDLSPKIAACKAATKKPPFTPHDIVKITNLAKDLGGQLVFNRPPPVRGGFVAKPRPGRPGMAPPMFAAAAQWSIAYDAWKEKNDTKLKRIPDLLKKADQRLADLNSKISAKEKEIKQLDSLSSDLPAPGHWTKLRVNLVRVIEAEGGGQILVRVADVTASRGTSEN